MLAPLLVTEDPYAAASVFSQAGWKLEYETARSGVPAAGLRVPGAGPGGPGHGDVPVGWMRCRAGWASSCSCTCRRTS